jgi:hypothetical protein
MKVAENWDVLEQRTPAFTRDFDRLPTVDQARVQRTLELLYLLIRTDETGLQARLARPMVPVLKRGLESSLRTARVGNDIRIILAVDEDPIFEQVLVTLLRVVRHKDLKKAFGSVAERLYQEERLSGDQDSGE